MTYIVYKYNNITDINRVVCKKKTISVHNTTQQSAFKLNIIKKKKYVMKI